MVFRFLSKPEGTSPFQKSFLYPDIFRSIAARFLLGLRSRLFERKKQEGKEVCEADQEEGGDVRDE